MPHTHGCPEPFRSCCSRHKLPACCSTHHRLSISMAAENLPQPTVPGHPLSSSHIQSAPFSIRTQPLLPLPPLPPYLSAKGLPTLYSSFALARGISSSSSPPKQLPSPCAIYLPCIFSKPGSSISYPCKELDVHQEARLLPAPHPLGRKAHSYRGVRTPLYEQ